MWREYLGLIGTIVGVINGVLAVVVTQFPLGSSRTKFYFIVAVGLLSLGGIVATIYSQYHLVSKTNAERAERREIREQLGAFLAQGTAIQARVLDTNDNTVMHEADLWGASVEAYLRPNLGESYISRFRSENGILLGQPTQADPARLPYWLGIRNRLVRLQEFIREVPQ